MVEKQSKKLVEVPDSLYFEEDLKKKLINAYAKYIKTKRQRLPSLKYEEECYEIKGILRSKLGEEDAEKIQLILTDYEDLMNLELELESKKLLMKETKQQATDTIDKIESINEFAENINFQQEVHPVVWQHFWIPK